MIYVTARTITKQERKQSVKETTDDLVLFCNSVMKSGALVMLHPDLIQ